MKFGSDKCSFFLIGGLDVVGTLTQFEDRREARTERSDGLGKGWEENAFVGVREGEITQEGFYDDAVGSIHDALSSGPGATAILSYCLEGTATGANFVGWAGGLQVNYDRQAARDALTKARASYRGNGVLEQGKVVFTYKNVGTTARPNALDNGVSSTGGAGYFQYNASAGEVNPRLVHSSDNLSYADLFVFDKVASGHGAQRMTTTGVIERYVAPDFTTASATGSIGALNAFMGLVRTSSTP